MHPYVRLFSSLPYILHIKGNMYHSPEGTGFQGEEKIQSNDFALLLATKVNTVLIIQRTLGGRMNLFQLMGRSSMV